jgi:hypothetical protein
VPWDISGGGNAHSLRRLPIDYASPPRKRARSEEEEEDDEEDTVYRIHGLRIHYPMLKTPGL